MRPYFTVLCFFLFLSAPAQPAFRGQVLGGNGPLAGATVRLGQRSLLTDSLGQFRAAPSVSGRLAYRITAVGHEPLAGHLQWTSADSLHTFQLEEAPAAMDAVVVTGTLRPVQRLESPIPVEVYSPQFFKKNPVPSLFEGLQQVNGVRPQINCSVCNTGDIHINGLEGPYTMVTIDGMPIVSSLSSVYGLFGLPTQLIERVEIVKGPASGLYGSEAIGGLINIITKTPAKAPRFSASTLSTSWNEHSADLGLRIGSKKTAGLVGLHYYKYGQPIDKNADGFTDVTLQHRVSLFNKWSFQRRGGRTASLAARYFFEDRWGGELHWTPAFRGTDAVYGESIRTNRWELIGNYQLPVTEKMSFSFSATHHHQDSYYGTTPYGADQRIAFGQLLWDKPLGNHQLLAGAALRYSFYDDNSTATVDTLSKSNAPERVALPGLFLQDEWAVGKEKTVLLGLRYDRHPVHGGIFTPRFAVKWKQGENVWRLNGGTGFRVVNLFTEDHAALTGARMVEVQEALKPERSYNLNLNYGRRFGDRSADLSVDAALWYSYFHNQIIADYETDPRKIIYDNLDGHAVSRGFTLNLEGSWRQRLRGLAGLTLQDVAKTETIDGKKERGRPMLTESWSATWNLSYSFPIAGLTLDYTGNVYGPMRLPLLSALDPRPATSPVWSLQNLQLTKRFSDTWEIFGGIKNLLDWTPARNLPFLIARVHDPFNKEVEYDSNGQVLPTPANPHALTFDPAYIYAPNQGRRVFLGVRFSVKH